MLPGRIRDRTGAPAIKRWCGRILVLIGLWLIILGVFAGTHAGLYESRDGGREWQRVALEGQDAMNLARNEGKTVWAAGHNVFQGPILSG